MKNKFSNYDEIKLKMINNVTCEQTEPLGKKESHQNWTQSWNQDLKNPNMWYSFHDLYKETYTLKHRFIFIHINLYTLNW